MKKFELISFVTAGELASHVAGAWLDEIESARRTDKPHCVALSGGRITHKLFTSVVEQAKVRKIGDGGTPSLPGNVHFFWADERCVPPDDPESNFKLADELLFAPLKIPGKQIHRIRGEDSPDAAVKSADEELRRVISGACFSPSPQRGEGRGEEAKFSNPLAPALSPLERGEGVESQPVLDLVFLGMGEDGHVASLFPDAPAEVVNHPGPCLLIENSPKPPPRRVSLSYAAIAAARQVWVLISGAGKEQALRESLDFSRKTPLAKVIELRQKTLIFGQIEADKII
ncbi:MAG: 6-phosphogluconolactonase [Limisphaerales bacterium]